MNLSPLPIQKFFANNGRPLVNGRLFTYVAGTDTPIATYPDASGLIPNTNPIILNFRGECRVWIDPQQAYKFTLAPPGNDNPPTNPIWTVDNITAAPQAFDNAAMDRGSVNNISLTIPQISSPIVFTRVVFKAANTNTGPTTLQINGGTARPLVWQTANQFGGGEIQQDGLYEAIFDGGNWQLQGPTIDPSQMITAAETTALVVPPRLYYRPLQTLQRNTNRYASISDALAVVATDLATEPVYYLEDWGATCDGVADDAPALQALINALYAADIHQPSSGRHAMPIIQLPAKAMRFATDLNIGLANGTTGFTIRGCGAWATNINVSAGVTITGFGSSNITWANLTFFGDAIDDDVTLFVITTFSGGSLRRWTFDHVDFFQIWKCFQTGGAVVCDEFKFIGCHFLECYYLMENNNEQSVNWNFWACDWESELVNTSKNVNDSVMFKLLKGTFINWYGGSIVLNGSLVLMETANPNDFSATTHAINFDGVRIELMDNAGFHAPLVTRNAASYSQVNPLKFTLQNFTLDLRGTLPTNLNLFDLRNTWTLVIRNGETQGGLVTGFFTSTSSTQYGSLWLESVIGITYTENRTGRLFTHDQHDVTLIPNNVSDRHIVEIAQRPGGSTGVAYTYPQRVFVRGTDNGGNLPVGGTNVNLPQFPNHVMLLTLVLQQFATTTQALTVQLRNQADTTTYASVSLAAGAGGGRENRSPIALEVGFQIGTEAAPVPLMLKFVGTPDVQKGVVWIDYM